MTGGPNQSHTLGGSLSAFFDPTCIVITVSYFILFLYREQLIRLRSENVRLCGLLKEQKSTECKESESTDASGNSSDGQAELKLGVETLQSELNGHSVLSKQGKSLKNSNELSDVETPVTTKLITSTAKRMESSQTKDQSHSRSAKQHVARHGVRFKTEVDIRFVNTSGLFHI